MPERERTKAGARREESAAEPPALQRQAGNAGIERRPEVAPRIWLLPTANGGWWAVPEETDALKLAAALCAQAPVLLCPDLKAIPEADARGAAKAQVAALIRGQRSAVVSRLVQRTLFGVALFAGAPLSLLFTGDYGLWHLSVVVAAVATGAGVFLLGVMPLGAALVKWNSLRIDAEGAVLRGELAHSPLAERLAQALRLRSTLPTHQRGEVPDAELLDARAYSKLIEDGVTTREELGVLGSSVAACLKLDAAGWQHRKTLIIAKDAGLDLETTIFYRDVAGATAELRLEQAFTA